MTNKENISGIIERITFHNSENGFCVLKTKVKKYRRLVTIVGNLPVVSIGEHFIAQGEWINDRDHGVQFKAEFLKSTKPTSLEGIEKYLGSGLIKGIGPYFAQKMVEKFSYEIFTVIENDSKRLTEISGIGQIRLTRIAQSWKEQKVIRDIMFFIQKHGVGISLATKIYKKYKQKAVTRITENPYDLAKDIKGIGFKTADSIASSFNIPTDSSVRIKAGIDHALLTAQNNGHCALPEDLLLEEAMQLLEVSSKKITAVLYNEVVAENLIKDTELIFLFAFHVYENFVAQKLFHMASKPLEYKISLTPHTLQFIERKLSIKLAEQQSIAVRKALASKVLIITGGPGTGKTTIIKSIITAAPELKIILCAPTGRAAKRLTETTGMQATTIHKLLNIRYEQDQAQDKEALDCNLLIIDEASMIDIKLMYQILYRTDNKTSLILVGDIDQLPSVGPGQVLKDLLDSRVFTVVSLNEIFRQEHTSQIVINAHLINRGKLPVLDKAKNDFYFLSANTPEEVMEKLLYIVSKRIPHSFNLDPIHDIQVLCPMQRGIIGTRALNVALQRELNTITQRIERFGQNYAVNDRVMQIENNYTKEVYNGDIGFVSEINTVEQEITIVFDQKRRVKYDFNELDQLTIAYAMTIHKAQGSEYDVVVIPLVMQHYLMLQKNLLYTAITRGKKLVVLIGEQKALRFTINNTRHAIRYSLLQARLLRYFPDSKSIDH